MFFCCMRDMRLSINYTRFNNYIIKATAKNMNPLSSDIFKAKYWQPRIVTNKSFKNTYLLWNPIICLLINLKYFCESSKTQRFHHTSDFLNQRCARWLSEYGVAYYWGLKTIGPCESRCKTFKIAKSKSEPSSLPSVS